MQKRNALLLVATACGAALTYFLVQLATSHSAPHAKPSSIHVAEQKAGSIDAPNLNPSLSDSTPAQPQPLANNLDAGNDQDEQAADPHSIEELIHYLQASDHPDDKLALMLITSNYHPDGLGELRNLLAGDPNNTLVLYAIISACEEQIDADTCANPELNQLKQLDPENAYVDELLARQAARNGNLHAALLHLKEAAKATNHDNYFWRDIKLAGDVHFRRNGHFNVGDFVNTIGITSAFTKKDYGSTIRLCKQNMGQFEWESACANLGKTLLDNAVSIDSQRIGSAMLTTYANDAELVQAEWDLNYEQITQEFQSFATILEAEPHIDIPMSVWQEYLQHYLSEGDIAANRHLMTYLQSQSSTSY